MSTVCFTLNIRAHACILYTMYGHVSKRSPRAFARTWAITQVKRVDMLYLGAYTESGCYFRLALFRAFTVCAEGVVRPCIVIVHSYSVFSPFVIQVSWHVVCFTASSAARGNVLDSITLVLPAMPMLSSR